MKHAEGWRWATTLVSCSFHACTNTTRCHGHTNGNVYVATYVKPVCRTSTPLPCQQPLDNCVFFFFPHRAEPICYSPEGTGRKRERPSSALTSISMGSTSIFFHSSSNCAMGIFFLTFPFFQSSVDSKKVNKHQAAKESTRWDVRGWGSTQGWSREWERRAGQSPLLERVLRSSVRLLSRLSRLQRGKETAAASGCRACLSDRVKLCSQPPSASLPPSYVATPLPPLTILP